MGNCTVIIVAHIHRVYGWTLKFFEIERHDSLKSEMHVAPQISQSATEKFSTESILQIATDVFHHMVIMNTDTKTKKAKAETTKLSRF